MYDTLQNTSLLEPSPAVAARRVRDSQKLSNASTIDQSTDDDEKCPVIRANQIFFTGGSAGRLRVVFF